MKKKGISTFFVVIILGLVFIIIMAGLAPRLVRFVEVHIFGKIPVAEEKEEQAGIAGAVYERVVLPADKSAAIALIVDYIIDCAKQYKRIAYAYCAELIIPKDFGDIIISEEEVKSELKKRESPPRFQWKVGYINKAAAGAFICYSTSGLNHVKLTWTVTAKEDCG